MSNRFVVDLSGVKLAKGMDEKIARNIQQAVLAGLAETQTQPELALRFPKEWLGLILHLDQRQIPALEKEISGRIR
ncbi:hypothetical protein ACHMW4_01345 [Mesorhizobium sp. UC22_110]|jgi:hypothetical protein|uniref:hypothetical protein n=1 Tax=unclassified Mesorhizobium TaxID=325217 RepID=UPI00366D9BC0